MKRFFVLVSLFFSFPAWATMVIPMGLKDMTHDAGKIFVGECLDRYEGIDENHLPATYTRWHVLQALKGVQTEDRFLVKMFGVDQPTLHVREGETALIPLRSWNALVGSFQPGEKYLLFLYPESGLGFTSPVGGGQGKFQVILPKSDGAALVVNPFGLEVILPQVQRWIHGS